MAPAFGRHSSEPFSNLEIAGGAGGLAHLLDTSALQWRADEQNLNGSPPDELNQKAVAETKEIPQAIRLRRNRQTRDDILVKLLGIKTAANQLP